MTPVACPHCGSHALTFRAKAVLWECESCEERFAGAALGEASGVGELTGRAARPKRIFFSYGHDANRELIDRFKVDLEKRGHQVWIDYKQIGSWDDWRGAITRGIHDSQLAVAFLSVHATRDPGVCRHEIEMALHHFGTVYPVLVEDMPRQSIPATIAHLQWPDLSQWREMRDGPDPGAFERFYAEKLGEIISRLEGEAERFAAESDVLREVLRPVAFDAKFAQHLGGFVGREWCFTAFASWLNQQTESRVFWVRAGPGFGKTALAVQLATRFRAAVVGTWFCDYQSRELSDPLQAVRTLAFQLALRWDDYRARLLPRLGLFAGSREAQVNEARQTLASKSLRDLFDLLLAGPTAGLIWRERKLVLVLDALDEVSDAREGRNDLAALVATEFQTLPAWLGVVVTSRPDPLVQGHLQGFKPFTLEASDERNEADLWAYGRARVQPWLGADADQAEAWLALLVTKSAGMVLYLRMVEEGLREGSLQPADLASLASGLPGLFSRYYDAFSRQFGLGAFVEQLQPLLRLILAAPGPMPLDLLAEVLGLNREEARRRRACLGAYLTDGPTGVELFHKTLAEWLGGEAAGGFYTDAASARAPLAVFLRRAFEGRRKSEHGQTGPLIWEEQVLDWLPLLLDEIAEAEQGRLMGELANLAAERLRWPQAGQLYERALAAQEKLLGPEHPDTLEVINNLGVFRTRTGDYSRAAELMRRALSLRQKILGEKNTQTLASYHNLGCLLREKGDLCGAESLLKFALNGREEVLGVEHPSTLRTVNNLALVYSDRGDYTQAKILSERALAGRIKTLGDRHLETLTSMHNHASLLRKLGNLNDSEELTRDVVDKREKILGSSHPDSLKSMQNLASLFHAKGDLVAALECYQRVLGEQARVLGESHPDFLHVKSGLAFVLKTMGDYAAALSVHNEVLEAKVAVFGVDHPSTSNSMSSIAGVLKATVRYEESHSMYLKALGGYKKIYGMKHPDTMKVIFNIGGLMKVWGNLAVAEKNFNIVLKFRTKKLGAAHPDTLRVVSSLAGVLQAQGRWCAAGKKFGDVLNIQRHLLGELHPDTLYTCDAIAKNFFHQGDYISSEYAYRRALAGREKVLGPEHPDTIDSALMLAQVLRRLDQLSAAIELLEARHRPGAAPAAAVRHKLACYYCMGGREAEAQPLLLEHLAQQPGELTTLLADDDLSPLHAWLQSQGAPAG